MQYVRKNTTIVYLRHLTRTLSYSIEYDKVRVRRRSLVVQVCLSLHLSHLNKTYLSSDCVYEIIQRFSN